MAKYNNRQMAAIDDWHLWNEVTRSISPLTSKSIIAAAKARIKADKGVKTSDLVNLSGKKPPRFNPPGAGKKVKPGWSPSVAPIHQLPGELFIPALEPKMHRKLRRGRMPIDARIDLHGMRQDEARRALGRFIEARIARGERTILVITGKGLKKTGLGSIEQRGVLRHMLPLWLKEPALAPFIAGLEVSAPQHGGEGAYYVRLKRLKS
ncbi:hypothetical protein MNBD_ALPHA12-744 [hydrothermal vent metagenome]|uniref:Smr domain-containing protein n=1 Tax=hydrothermal vent metagenome TaxID=652676 RepID=A0A3B0UFQ3_9ZZZZ